MIIDCTSSTIHLKCKRQNLALFVSLLYGAKYTKYKIPNTT